MKRWTELDHPLIGVKVTSNRVLLFLITMFFSIIFEGCVKPSSDIHFSGSGRGSKQLHDSWGATYTLDLGKWGVTCNWCSKRVENHFTAKSAGAKVVEFHQYKNCYRDGIYVGHFKTRFGSDGIEEGREFIRNLPNAIYGIHRLGDNEFCSLKCINAYKASIGVKESRQRVIIDKE